jgi:hypothetical protein
VFGLAGAAVAGPDSDGWDENTCRATEVSAVNDGSVELGERVHLDVTVAALSGRELIAAGCDVLFVVEPDVLGIGALEEGGVVRLFGVLATDARSGGTTFLVKRIDTVTAGDVAAAGAEIERLVEARDADGLFRLGDSLLVRGQRTSPETALTLRLLAERAYRGALELRRAQLKPGDREALLALSDQTLELLDDRQTALEMLLSLLEPGGTPAPDVAQRLRDLDAVPYGADGEWVLYEEMKRREGFVLQDGVWLRREHAGFLDAISRQLRDRSRPRSGMLPEFFAEAAKKRQVIPGMRKRELAAAIGLPDAFDRMRTRGNLYDAWLYDDRGAFYFENDVLFEVSR